MCKRLTAQTVKTVSFAGLPGFKLISTRVESKQSIKKLALKAKHALENALITVPETEAEDSQDMTSEEDDKSTEPRNTHS